MNRGMRLLIVDDEPLFLETLERLFTREGARVRTASDGAEALQRLEEGPFDVVLADVAMPRMGGMELLPRVRSLPEPPEVVMLTAFATIETAVEAMKLGAYDYLQKPAEVDDVERVLVKAFEKVMLTRENRRLRSLLERHDPYQELVGSGARMQEVRSLIVRVAPADSTVLVLGPSGAGKELVVRAIHAASARAGGPFLTLNCGALASSLLENELFGHVAGAYTGAVKAAQGLFEAADGGTLFIDEIAEMDLEIQKAFLRVLESGEYRRVGEARTRQTNARILAATNRDLTAAVAQGRFREDLYYRLNVFAIEVPPLAEHMEDLPELVEHLLGRLAPPGRTPKRLDNRAMRALNGHSWPGNVRELRNAIERGLIMSTSDVVTLDDLPLLVPQAPSPDPAPALPGPGDEATDSKFLTIAELEKEQIRRALEMSGGNKTKAARLLGVSLRSLYTKLDRHGLSP